MQGNDYYFGLTAAGKALAAERAPSALMPGPRRFRWQPTIVRSGAQAAHVRRQPREPARRPSATWWLPESLLDQLGPALISQKALFLYGPTGNGKTSLAERLLRVYEDAVLIPYALEMSGYIITLFDPVLHRPLRAAAGRSGCAMGALPSPVHRRRRRAGFRTCWNCGPTLRPAFTPRRCR